MGLSPPLENSDIQSTVKQEIAGPADAVEPQNSAARAEDKKVYVPVARPENLEQLIDTINMWGYYIKHWGARIDDEFHELRAKIDGANPAVKPTSHLDPPPEPYSPPPS